MRLLAARKDSVGNHSFIILSFSRERASVKVPPVVGWFAFRTDGNRRRKEEGPREDVVNPTVKSSFCQASRRILKRAATKERIVGEHRNTRGASSPRECRHPVPVFFGTSIALRLCFFDCCSTTQYFQITREETDREDV